MAVMFWWAGFFALATPGSGAWAVAGSLILVTIAALGIASVVARRKDF